ncbi:hypothetical protein [Cohaesibacter intestini]|uniref:hypothetical protein n=1 Tax=Cohaesibacter intestini TaxID=2211145 RepID=UPI0013002F61|nr:hypothetical protein [Cohaesibacter intestini]
MRKFDCAMLASNRVHKTMDDARYNISNHVNIVCNPKRKETPKAILAQGAPEPEAFRPDMAERYRQEIDGLLKSRNSDMAGNLSATTNREKPDRLEDLPSVLQEQQKTGQIGCGGRI